MINKYAFKALRSSLVVLVALWAPLLAHAAIGDIFIADSLPWRITSNSGDHCLLPNFDGVDKTRAVSRPAGANQLQYSKRCSTTGQVPSTSNSGDIGEFFVADGLPWQITSNSGGHCLLQNYDGIDKSQASPRPASVVSLQYNNRCEGTSQDRSLASVVTSPKESPKTGRSLVFSDEFNCSDFNRFPNSGGINPAKWNTQYVWGSDIITNGEDQYYVNPSEPSHDAINFSPFSCQNNVLRIRSAPTPNSKKSLVKKQPFLSGVLSGHGLTHRKFGYFEARLKIPKGGAGFPAFWLLHQQYGGEGTKRLEIDIVEFLTGKNPHMAFHTVHYFDGVTNTNFGTHRQLSQPESYYDSSRFGTNPSHIDFSQDFHTYAVDWKPGEVIWYIDDVKVAHLLNSNVSHEALYPIINLARGGNWNDVVAWGGSGPLTALDRRTTLELEIDYVRIYD